MKRVKKSATLSEHNRKKGPSAALLAKGRKARRALLESRLMAQEPNSPRALVARARIRARDYHTVFEDSGRELIKRTDKRANKHASRLVDLTVRALAMFDSVEMANRRFDDAELSDIKLDGRAQQTVKRSIEKLMDVALFSMVAREMIDDRTLRAMIVDLYTKSRFVRLGEPSNPAGNKGADNKQKILRDALQFAVDSF